METTISLAKEHGLAALTLVAVIYLGMIMFPSHGWAGGFRVEPVF